MRRILKVSDACDSSIGSPSVSVGHVPSESQNIIGLGLPDSSQQPPNLATGNARCTLADLAAAVQEYVHQETSVSLGLTTGEDLGWHDSRPCVVGPSPTHVCPEHANEGAVHLRSLLHRPRDPWPVLVLVGPISESPGCERISGAA